MVKVSVLFSNSCVEVIERRYREYSELEFDFYVPTDTALRKEIYELISRYAPHIITKIRLKKHRALFKASIWDAAREDYIIPLLSLGSIVIAVGRSLIILRLPIYIIDWLKHDNKIIEKVRSWCDHQMVRQG